MTPTHLDRQIMALVSQITGHALEDLDPDLFLESDLGIDSIKMVELLNGIVQLIPEDCQSTFLEAMPMENLMQLQTLAEIIGAVQDTISSSSSPTFEPSSVISSSIQMVPVAIASTIDAPTLTDSTPTLDVQLVALVSQITGHASADLDPDLFLESDLGIDSIKMVELLNGIVQRIPEDRQGDFLQALPMETLMQLQTLAEVDRAVRAWLSTPSVLPIQEAPVLVTSGEVKADAYQTVEISDVQTYHLLSYWVVDSNSICSTIRWQGEFDEQIAWQSWQDLIARHPLLRSYIHIPEQATRFQDYQLRVLESPISPQIPLTDIRHLDGQQQQQTVEETYHQWLNWQWQLTEWPLQRFEVLRLEDSLYQIFLVHEHFIADGLSTHILWREWLEIYHARSRGQAANLPPATSLSDYKQLIRSFNSWHDPAETEALADYLKRQGKQGYVWNPTGKSLNTAPLSFRNRPLRLSAETTRQLITQTQALRLPMNTLLLAAFLRAIAQFDPLAQTLILQVPTSGRVYPHLDAGTMVGDFAQNLALNFDRTQVEADWLELLASVQQSVQEGLARGYDRERYRQLAAHIKHQVVLQQGKVPDSSLAIFRAALKSNLYCPYTGHTHLQSQYGSIKLLDYRSGGINAAGTLDLLQEIFDDRLHLFLSYDCAFFPDSLMAELLCEYQRQLETLAALKIAPTLSVAPAISDPQLESLLLEITQALTHQTLSAADLDRDLEAELGLDSLELIRLVTQISQCCQTSTTKSVDRQKLLSCRRLREMVAVLCPTPNQILPGLQDGIPYQAIVEQARRTPNAIAILDGTQQLTYQQLHQQSNQLAHYLRSQGVQPGHKLGIMTGRNAQLWIGILGILKAGAAYVPIDAAYPSDRIQYMLERAEIAILLSEAELAVPIQNCLAAATPVQTLVLLAGESPLVLSYPCEQVTPQSWSQFPASDLPCYNQPTDLMTVLFTSGSTGRPKGVMLNHQGYMNRLVWMQKAFPLTAGDRVAQKTSCCFDISVWEIFWPLMVGATACPIDRAVVKNPWQFAQWLNDTRISVQHFVPSLFGEFINALEGETWEFPHLRWLIFSGEALPVPFIQRWVDRHGWKVGLANLYGPTEASIDVTAHIIEPASLTKADSSISIGQAIDNVSVIVLDNNRQPVPVGELGELCIGGIQLATGYLHEPEKTAAAFIANPFPQIESSHLYRTGDLVKELADGSLEYHGRIDHQVKIRGFRIELGEIESVLNAHEAVQEAAAIVLEYEPGQKQLVAVLSGQPVAPLLLKQYLSGCLPDYMIPHRLEWLPSLPKNHNGKLDRNCLKQLLQSPSTIANVPDEQSVARPSQEAAEVYLPLGPAQKWLVRYFEPPYQWTGYTRCLYHQPLDGECFNQAINYVIQRHFALKTVFVQRDGQWWQKYIDNPEPLSALFYDGSMLEAEQRDEQVRRLTQELSQQLRIDRWPLIAVLVVKVNDNCYDINIIGHHIIGDLLSNRVVSSEFWQIYALILGGKSECLAELPSHPSYADYVQMLMAEEQKGNLESHVEYWTSQFPSPRSAFSLPYDRQLGANLETSAESQWFILSQAESQALLKRAKQHYGCNLYPLLLAPLYRLMAEWGERNEVVVSHRSHSRNLGDNRQFFNSVGNFAGNFPVGLSVDATQPWKQTIALIQSKLEELPMNGCTFDWISDRLPSYLYPDNYLSPVRANYLGNRDLPASPLFEFVKADWDRRLCPPEQKRTTLLEFFFSIAEGRLELQVEYSLNFHLPETIEHLGQRYLTLLRDLLAAVPPLAAAPVPQLTVAPPAPDNRPLAGKVALLLGGHSQIDTAIASRLAQQGAKVAVIAQNANAWQEMAAQIRQQGGVLEAIAVDWSDSAQVQTGIDRIGTQWGGIDLLINHPGLPTLPESSSANPRLWRNMVENLLLTPYHGVQCVLPYFRQQGKGKIITLSSASAWESSPWMSAYTMACQGLMGFTQSLAAELNPQKIQVNGLCLHGASSNEIQSLEPLLETICFLVSAQADNLSGQHWQLSLVPTEPPSESAEGERLTVPSAI